MPGKIDQRLADLGIEIPVTPAPQFNYVPVQFSDHLAFVAGQVPMADGAVRYSGQVGTHLDVEAGQAAARLCAINMLAQLKTALDGDLDRIVKVLRVGGFVSCAADFTAQGQVINGASDLLVEVLGDAGRHARAAVGCSSLPLGAAVEVEGLFMVDR